MCAELNLTPKVLQNLTLIEIGKILESNRSSLKFFPTMPYPNGFITQNCGNRLVYAELDYNTAKPTRFIPIKFQIYDKLSIIIVFCV